MTDFLPNRIEESSDEDLQIIQKDIQALAKKYILPIDKIRSISKPSKVSGNSSDDGFEDLGINGTEAMESRCHAFYRYIGFPVASESGFYNPGFDSTAGQNSKRKKSIDSKFNSSKIKTVTDEREDDSISLKKIFKKQNIYSSIYTLLLKHIRPFQMMSEGSGPFEEDLQTKDINVRTLEAEEFFNNNPNIDKGDAQNFFVDTIVGFNFTGVRHILRPFVVDPRIDNTVMPDRNRVTVPFLSNRSDTKIGENIELLRPGLELIIRERLRDNSNEAVIFLETIRKIAEGETSQNNDSANLNESTLRLTVEALLNKTEVDSSIADDLAGISNIQVKNITQLVKTIKVVIAVLYDSIVAIYGVSELINWVPVMSTEGPEMGEKGAILNRNKISPSSDLDKKIVELKVKALVAQNRTSQGNDLGNFASPFNATVNDQDINKINEELQTLTQKRNKIAALGFKAIGNIELIMGEVSGLGLIDILAIYIALWAMDEEAIINLLDEEAFGRMIKYFPNLKVGEAEVRAFAGSSRQGQIESALKEFEKVLINVFSFVDREYLRQFVAPGEIPGGFVGPNN